MIVVEILLIIFLFALFAISHSFLASRKLKKTLAKKIGKKVAFYRLFYNISAIIFFAAVYTLAPEPDLIIYDLQYPFDIITFALQILSLVGLVWAVSQIDLKEFLGISQINRYLRGEYNAEDLDQKQTFNITGASKFTRHPIYLFCILFLGLRPTMSLFYMIMFICCVIYFYVGSFYEERKLVEIFGNDYKSYQKKVPRIFPIKLRSTVYDR